MEVAARAVALKQTKVPKRAAAPRPVRPCRITTSLRNWAGAGCGWSTRPTHPPLNLVSEILMLELV